MSGNDKTSSENKLPEALAADLHATDKHASDSTNNVNEQMQCEARQGMQGFVDQTKTQSNDSTVSNLFGDCTIDGAEQAKTESLIRKPLAEAAPVVPLGKVLDLPAKHYEDASEASKEFKTRALETIADARKDLKITNDGSPAKVVDYRDKFQVTEPKTALELASEQIGASATDAQVKAFAQQILRINGKSVATTFEAGSIIRMPGQTEDGGIVNKKAGITSTEWQDGTRLEVTESGRGSAFTLDQEGNQIETSWDPKTLNGNLIMSIGDAKTFTVSSNGERVEKTFIPKAGANGAGDFQTTSITSSDAKGRTIVKEIQPDKVRTDKVSKIVITSTDQSKLEFMPHASGQFFTADGKAGIDGLNRVYTRNQEANGLETRTFDNGSIETLNAKGQKLKSSGPDDWGRQTESVFKPGSAAPEKMTVHTNDGRVVELFRDKDTGVYCGHEKKADGTKGDEVELGEDGRLTFDDGDKYTAVLKDGTTVTDENFEDGTSNTTYRKGAETFVEKYNVDGDKVSDTFTNADGRVVSMHYGSEEELTQVKMENTDGSITEVNIDNAGKIAKGFRVDKVGNVVESVQLHEDKFIYADLKTGTVRAEKLLPGNGEEGMPSFVEGSYDVDTGAFTYINADGLKATEPSSPGRTDVVQKDGSIVGSTIGGDESTLKSNGVATVLHDDETGVRINANKTIDRWGETAADSAYGEELTENEAKFIAENPDIDLRDVAEVHRRLAGDQAELDRFYQSLSSIDSAENLTSKEKAILQKNIVHHVAYPGEIYQGLSPSCNSAVVQRDLAINRPDLYSSLIVDALNNGNVKTADGTVVPLDVENLKMADSSGRDLASRVFQTAALAIEFYPDAVFRNTADGAGKLYSLPFSESSKSASFDGLNLAQIADLRFKLTGEEKAIALVDDISELRVAFQQNGGGPMIIGVDGDNAPFDANSVVTQGDGMNHVVSLVKLTQDRAYVQNQWGLEGDHSSSKTALTPDALIKNMKVQTFTDIKAGPGIVITRGNHRSAYQVENGKLVLDPKNSKVIREEALKVPTLK
jgi:hypothetical protein